MIPDKIYFPADGLPSYIDLDGSPIRTKQVEETDAPVYPSEQEVQKASEQYADGMWLSGSSWADAARKTFLAGANWMKYHID